MGYMCLHSNLDFNLKLYLWIAGIVRAPVTLRHPQRPLDVPGGAPESLYI